MTLISFDLIFMFISFVIDVFYGFDETAQCFGQIMHFKDTINKLLSLSTLSSRCPASAVKFDGF